MLPSGTQAAVPPDLASFRPLRLFTCTSPSLRSKAMIFVYFFFVGLDDGSVSSFNMGCGLPRFAYRVASSEVRLRCYALGARARQQCWSRSSQFPALSSDCCTSLFSPRPPGGGEMPVPRREEWQTLT